MKHWAPTEAEHCGGLAAFLESRAPQCTQVVGRVTLHLAENKGDDELLRLARPGHRAR